MFGFLGCVPGLFLLNNNLRQCKHGSSGFAEIIGDDFPVFHAHKHIIVRSWQSLIVSAQSLSPRHSSDEPDWISCWVFLQRVSRSRCPLH